MQESTINNPNELVNSLKTIKYLIEAGKIKPINLTEKIFLITTVAQPALEGVLA